jgi:hypothetical protein
VCSTHRRECELSLHVIVPPGRHCDFKPPLLAPHVIHATSRRHGAAAAISRWPTCNSAPHACDSHTTACATMHAHAHLSVNLYYWTAAAGAEDDHPLQVWGVHSHSRRPCQRVRRREAHKGAARGPAQARQGGAATPMPCDAMHYVAGTASDRPQCACRGLCACLPSVVAPAVWGALPRAAWHCPGRLATQFPRGRIHDNAFMHVPY